jgi:hypothetical protein
MQAVVRLPQRPDGTEPLDRSLRGDVRGCDSVGALEVGHDEPAVLGHSLVRLTASASSS